MGGNGREDLKKCPPLYPAVDRKENMCIVIIYCPVYDVTNFETNRSFKELSYHLFVEINNRNTRKKCEICSKLTIKTPERSSDIFIVNFEHVSHLFLVSLLSTLSK